MKFYKYLITATIIISTSCKHKVEEKGNLAIKSNQNQIERLEGEALLDTVQKQTLK